jgi:3-dehydroquinate synthase
MSQIILRPKSHQPPSRIVVGAGALKTLPDLIDLRRFSNIALITGSRTARHWLKPVARILNEPLIITLPTTRPRKTLESAARIYEQLHRAGFDRQSLMITLGGGVIGDLGGYVAATYLRGIAFIQIPTTLLAQADASVGGKVGVNLGTFKNGIGAFHLPRLVLSDTDTVATLPARERRNGLAEIIKLGLISDRSLFEAARTIEDVGLTSLVIQAVRRKAAIVNQDEREDGPRKLLNFGHTIGHALESLSLKTEKPLRHGEAISLGMLAEARLAVAAGLCSESVPTALEAALRHAKLPTKNAPVSITAAMKLIERDKKNQRRVVSWTLPTAIGQGRYDQTVPDALVRKSLRSVTR